MSTDLEPYRTFITHLYCDQRLDEDKILQRLEDEEGIITDALTFNSYLEQWHLIPSSPSPIDSYSENPEPEAYEERHYPQHINCFHESDQGTQYHESNMLLDNQIMGPTPLETYIQEEQPNELFALRFSTTRATTQPKSHRVNKTDPKPRRKGKEKSENRGGSSSAPHEIQEASNAADRGRGGRRKK